MIALGQRIWITGPTGAGKTTIGKLLAKCTGSPHFELDSLYWEAGWQSVSAAEFKQRVANVVRGDSWIIDGDYHIAQDIILARADQLIWLDVGLLNAVAGVVKRSALNLVSPATLWNDNRESLTRLLSRESVIVYGIRSHWERRDLNRRLMAAARAQSIRALRVNDPRQWLSLVEHQVFGRGGQ